MYLFYVLEKLKMKKIIIISCIFYLFSTVTCFAVTGKITCPKTVKAGEYYEYSLEDPDEDCNIYPYDDEVEAVLNSMAFKCNNCEKWFYLDELIDSEETVNGIPFLMCPICPEALVREGWILPNGREVKNMVKSQLGAGHISRGWGCNAKITENATDTVPIDVYNSRWHDSFRIRVPGTYYLTVAFGIAEICDLTVKTIDPQTRQLIDVKDIKYAKARYVDYAHYRITALGKISFNANGGKLKKSNRWIKQNGKVGTLSKPTKKGYKFKGWFTKKKGGKKITKDTKVFFTKASVTYYAKWVK